MRLTGARIRRSSADPAVVPEWFEPYVDDAGRLVVPHRGVLDHLLGASGHDRGDPGECHVCNPRSER